MKLVILESPYAGNIEANVAYARKCVRDCLKRDESPIASHLLFTQPDILRDEVAAERSLGIAAGLAWRPKAHYSVFYTDRGWSNGMLEALKLCLHGGWGNGFDFRIRSLSGGVPSLPQKYKDPAIVDLLRSKTEGNFL